MTTLIEAQRGLHTKIPVGRAPLRKSLEDSNNSGRGMMRRMSTCKGRRFAGEVILWGVRRCCRYRISSRELKKMLTGCRVAVDQLKHDLARIDFRNRFSDRE